MKELTKLIVKILSLYFICIGIINTINITASIILQKNILSQTSNVVQFVILPISYLLVGVVLWNISDFMANLIYGKTETVSEKIILNDSQEILIKVSVIIIGIVMSVFAVPNIISDIYSLISLSSLDSNLTAAVRERSSLIADILKLIIGFILVFKFKGITRLINIIGNLGIYKGEEKKN